MAKHNKVDKETFINEVCSKLLHICFDYPEFTMAEHIAHWLRSKGKHGRLYDWKDWDLYTLLTEYEKELQIITKEIDEGIEKAFVDEADWRKPLSTGTSDEEIEKVFNNRNDWVNPIK